jgi:uncharacterized protein (TIGR03435 family)
MMAMFLRLTSAILIAGAALAQRPPAFGAASIKPNKSAERNATWRWAPGGRFIGDNIRIKFLIMTAFKLKESQVAGIPNWTDGEKYDIQAKAEGNPTPDQTLAMVQALLMDRFHLKYHRAKKEVSVYALVPAKSGVKVKDAKDGPCPSATEFCGNWFARRAQIEGARLKMPQLADALALQLDRIVVDKTGFTNTFDLLLTWSPDPDPGDKPDAGEGPSIFTAVQEQLGLRLEASKAPVDILVVDHIEKPTEN